MGKLVAYGLGALLLYRVFVKKPTRAEPPPSPTAPLPGETGEVAGDRESRPAAEGSDA